MSTLNDRTPHTVYLFNPQANYLEIYDTISKCLAQAEALVLVASNCDTEEISRQIMDSYLWAIRDMIAEARYLHGKLHEKINQIH